MKKTPWFERIFPPIEDNGLYLGILERLEGTPARLTHKMITIGHLTAPSPDGKWSIKKEIGHLIDLEPIWRARSLQIIGDEKHLLKADLSNTQTHQTDHDAVPMDKLLAHFAEERGKTMQVLRHIEESDLEKAAVHPRLGTPMRLIDLAFFVAEHDDHHLAQMSMI
jgi:uncharacterized damage-inducible protein DinB